MGALTEPVLVVTRRETSPVMAAHPLATKTGVELMMHLLNADTMWRGCTKPQRAWLEEVCPPLVSRLLATGALSTDDMPVVSLPAQRMAALRRRGLVDDTGRLTGHAVHTYYWVRQFREPEVRPAPSSDVYPLAVQ